MEGGKGAREPAGSSCHGYQQAQGLLDERNCVLRLCCSLLGPGRSFVAEMTVFVPRLHKSES